MGLTVEVAEHLVPVDKMCSPQQVSAQRHHLVGDVWWPPHLVESLGVMLDEECFWIKGALDVCHQDGHVRAQHPWTEPG